MDKINIAFAFDRNYYRQGIIAISSLILKAKENGGNVFYDIYLLINNDVKPKIQKEILNVLNEKYDKINITFINMQNLFENSYECRGISNACYYRLMLHRILPNLDKIIYSDVDVIFNTDLSEIYGTDMSNYYYASNKDIILNLEEKRKDFKTKYNYWNIYLRNIGKNYRNSGFLILNLKKLRDANIDDKIIELSKQEFNFQDQDVLNIIFQDKQNYVKNISPEYCFLCHRGFGNWYEKACNEGIISLEELNNIKKCPKIFHYAGLQKPWETKCDNDNIWWNFVKNNNLYYGYFKKKSFAQKLFSIKNECKNSIKRKVIRILGIKFSLKVSQLNKREKNIKKLLKNIFSIQKSRFGDRMTVTIFWIKFNFKTVKQYKINDYGLNNKFYIIDENGEKYKIHKAPIKIRVYGNNNLVVIPKHALWLDSEILIRSNSNQFIFKDTSYVTKLYVEIGNGDYSIIYIGENTLIADTKLYCNEKNTKIIIGKDCMFATDTCLLCGDGHTIKNKKTEEVINFADSIEIGNHCWIGKFSNILKNSKVAEGCIVGMSTNVTASVATSPNSIVAGNPAKVIKTNIEWERTSPSVYKTDLDANQ